MKKKETCKKIRFPNKAEADEFVKDFEHEPEQTATHVPVRSYFCQECTAWHVTSKERHRKKLRPYVRKNDDGKLFSYAVGVLKALNKKGKKKNRKKK